MIKREYIITNWLFSFWPILLLISQKALLPIQILSFIIKPRIKDKFLKKNIINLLIFLSLILIDFLLNGSINNFYGIRHFLPFVIFSISIVLISLEMNDEKIKAFAIGKITEINFIVLIIVYITYFIDFDFSSFRGLNFIRGTDGQIHRVFIETTVLLILSDFKHFKSKILNKFLLLLTLGYIFFLCKSILVIILFGIKIYYDYPSFFKPKKIFAYVFISSLILNLFNDFSYRADFYLSFFFKAEQLTGILNTVNFNKFIFGNGFGFFIEDFVTDAKQPYQIEMQLPLLFLQIGFFGLITLAAFMYFLFKINSDKTPFKKTLLFFSVGLVNPWMFLPTWFILCHNLNLQRLR